MNPRGTKRILGRAAGTAVLLTLLAGTAACSSSSAGGTAEPAPPATIETPAGGGPAKVTLTDDAVRRIDLHTALVRHAPVTLGGRVVTDPVVPYSAVVYDGNGASWAYAELSPRVFVRQPLQIAAIHGDVAVLAKGPADGTAVVTVGAPLLLGAEAQIAGEQ